MDSNFSFKIVVLSVSLLFFCNTVRSQKNIQQNLSSDDSTKIEALLNQMTLEEKIGQSRTYCYGLKLKGEII